MTRAAIILITFAAQIALAAGDANLDNGARLYQACSTCHQADGRGSRPLDAPRIAGRDAWTTAAQLEAFASGRRGDHPDDIYGRQMALFAKALQGDEAIRDVAAYVQGLAAVVPNAVVAGDAARGRQKYATCGACHGADGRGVQALNAPALAGLEDWYLLRQLENFRAGRRGYAADDANGQQMRAAAQVPADDDDLLDIVAYVATLGSR
jgi:cytochrome c oxidase subunit 2